MKTKIIYISGNEIFDMADIRAAFDQVRAALSLGNDTVLFGVPVDRENALDNAVTESVISDNKNADSELITENTAMDTFVPTEITPVPVIDMTESGAMDAVDTDISAPDMATEYMAVGAESEPAMDTEDITPVKKSRGRPRTKHIAETPIITADNTETDTAVIDETPAPDQGKVISILSVLKSDPSERPIESEPVDIDDQTTQSDVITEDIVEPDEPAEDVTTDDATEDFIEIDIEDMESLSDSADAESVAEPDIDEYENEPFDDVADVESDPVQENGDTEDAVSVHDIISDEEPTSPMEKTLEHLLESMTPLREDTEHDIIDHTLTEPETDDNDPNEVLDTSDDIDTFDDADATLEKLATEFAERQNDINISPKNTSHGKIGKLKNILPFKKVKHDDSGLMGDLFGWAGIAANDEDFSIPGFFTNAASKK